MIISFPRDYKLIFYQFMSFVVPFVAFVLKNTYHGFTSKAL